MRKSVMYVTGNSAKIAAAKHYLEPKGITIFQEKIKIDEIQSESIEDVAIDKAKKAFEQIKKPLLVNDSGWLIPALNGFPGPYMKFLNQWFTPEDFLHLMKGKNDRSIILRDVYVYYDGNQIKVFEYDNQGTILNEKRGEGLPSDTVVSLSGNGKSISEINEEGKSNEDYKKFWDDFPAWLKTQN